jgi:hypothetical protein
MYMENPVVIKASVTFERDLYVKDYTAKLVKSLLISGNPELGELFSRAMAFPPKPIHLTPLYTHRIGRENQKRYIEPVYAKYIPSKPIAKPPDVNKLRPVRIEAGKEYFFYIGTNIKLMDNILLSLSNVNKFIFGNDVVAINQLRYEIEYVNVEKKAEEIRSILEASNKGYMKVIFNAPTLLKDPLVITRRKKRKLLLPLPEAVLSTSFFMTLIDMGRVRSSFFITCMRYIKSIFDIPYTVLKTINLVWYVYDNELLPALIGYVKYYIDSQLLRRIQKVVEMKHNLDFTDLLSKSMVLAQIYGSGDGRATGFGHVSIVFPSV